MKIHYRIARNGQVIEPVTKFTSRRAANKHVLDAFAAGTMEGAPYEYTALPFDEKGYPVERVGEADQETAAAHARWLAANEPDIAMAFNTMVLARQLYKFALSVTTAVLATVTKIDGKKTLPHHLTVELLEQAASNLASKEFEALDMYSMLAGNIFPWLDKSIRSIAQTDVAEQVATAAEKEKKRRAVKIPINLEICADGTSRLPRTTPLLLVGYAPAVQYLLDMINAAVLTASNDDQPGGMFSVVRLSNHQEISDTLIPNREQQVPQRLWLNCAHSQEKLAKFVSQKVHTDGFHGGDLIIVDDLADCFTLGAMDKTGGLAPARLADACKKLSRWFIADGLGMVAGAPVSDRKFSASAPELSHLRAQMGEHCVIRVVEVIDEAPDLAEDLCRLKIGDWSIDVSKLWLQ